jgi:hypothetical protein
MGKKLGKVSFHRIPTVSIATCNSNSYCDL